MYKEHDKIRDIDKSERDKILAENDRSHQRGNDEELDTTRQFHEGHLEGHTEKEKGQERL